MREEIRKIVFKILEMFKRFFYTDETFKLEEQSLMKEYEEKILQHEKTENHILKTEKDKMNGIIEKKDFNETAIILTEMEEGPVQVNIAQMREVLTCFCELAYTWSDQQIIDFIKRYGAPK